MEVNKDANIVAKIIENMEEIPEKNFLISSYLITDEQWSTIMGGMSFGESHFDRCVYAFLNKLNNFEKVKSVGLIFRIPTEIERKDVCSFIAINGYEFVIRNNCSNLFALGNDGVCHSLGGFCGAIRRGLTRPGIRLVAEYV